MIHDRKRVYERDVIGLKNNNGELQYKRAPLDESRKTKGGLLEGTVDE